jgi:two-component system, LytTR family, sensor histidine kinase AlgZ
MSRSPPPTREVEGSTGESAGARRGAGKRDLVSVAWLIVILMLIAAAITAILADQQRVGIVTWLVLLFVSGCFAGAYLALRRLVMPPLQPGRHPAWVRLGVHALVVLAAVGIGSEIAARSLELAGGDPAARTRRNVLPVGLAITVAMVIVEEGYRRLRRLAREHELREEHMRRQAMKAELAAIRARTDPHFLFNSLNTVAGLIEEDPGRAAQVLQRLAGLFRYALEGSRSEHVPLGEEIRAVRTYLEVEGLRFGDRLQWSVEVDESLLDWPVPPLLLQPVVENAVNHGISPRRGPGRIEVRAAAQDGRLHIEIEDDGLGVGASPGKGSGTALTDIEERLRLSYGSDASLRRDAGGALGGYLVRIVVPTRPGEAVAR